MEAPYPSLVQRWGRSVPCNVSAWQPSFERYFKGCCTDVVFPASVPVPPSSQPKKQTHSLQWVPSERGFGNYFSHLLTRGRLFNFWKFQLWKGLEWSWNTSSRFLNPTCKTANSVLCAMDIFTGGRPLNIHPSHSSWAFLQSGAVKKHPSLSIRLVSWILRICTYVRALQCHNFEAAAAMRAYFESGQTSKYT